MKDPQSLKMLRLLKFTLVLVYDPANLNVNSVL